MWKSVRVIDCRGNILNDLVQLRLFLHILLHSVDGVKNRGMMAAAKLLTDFRQGELSHLTDNIHSHISGVGDFLVLALSSDGLRIHLI